MKTRMLYEVLINKSANHGYLDVINQRLLHNLYVEGETPNEIHEIVNQYISELASKAQRRPSVLSNPDDSDGYIKNNHYYQFCTGDVIYITKKQVRAI